MSVPQTEEAPESAPEGGEAPPAFFRYRLRGPDGDEVVSGICLVTPKRLMLRKKLTARGGTALPEQPVAVIDPQSGQEVARGQTDLQGNLVVQVPEQKNYTIRILDDADEDEHEAEAAGGDSGALHEADERNDPAIADDLLGELDSSESEE